jgi:hypothetical protein
LHFGSAATKTHLADFADLVLVDALLRYTEQEGNDRIDHAAPSMVISRQVLREAMKKVIKLPEKAVSSAARRVHLAAEASGSGPRIVHRPNHAQAAQVDCRVWKATRRGTYRATTRLSGARRRNRPWSSRHYIGGASLAVFRKSKGMTEDNACE